MKVSNAIKLLMQFPGDDDAIAILQNPPKLPEAPVPVAPSKPSLKKKTAEPESENGGQG